MTSGVVVKGVRGLLVALLMVVASVTWPGSGYAAAEAWSLTTAQRQAYLSHYAPVIFKRGDENNGREGSDWLSNYDFDRDGNFSDNRVDWRTIGQYATAGANPQWRIRPTLYTALIEYTENGVKNLVLLYHVYNAADKDFTEIHDWERIEIVLRGVTGTPGAGETVGHVTITSHKDHVMRRGTDSAVNFMPAATGKHLLLWQADHSNFDLPSINPHGHELRFATTSWSTIAARMESTSTAEVDINNDNEKNVHYAFVPEGSAAAVAAWRAQAVTSATANSLASKVDNGTAVSWQATKRVTYELQDLADIVPTHWQHANWQTHWLADKSSDVLLESPVTAETGAVEVSAGLQRFYTASRDSGESDLTDGREGILSKNWFYGAYSGEENADEISGSDDFGGYEGVGLDSAGRSRGVASGDPASHNAYWRQHDFFVHTGAVESADHREVGTWLTGDWYTTANGGFDGRWTQLFDDRTDAAPAATVPAAMLAPAADRVLRVYNNNIENLVRNNSDGTCTRISGPDHLTSMLVDDAGRTGTAGVVAPDILIVQQVRGTGQAQAYADQLSAKFGLAAGTYRAIVAWSDPESWGSSHHCSDQSLGDLKKKQTNGIIYNSSRLSLAAGDVSKYWSAGWLKPGTAYNGGAGCTLYKPPDNDDGATNEYKWKRTSAIAARFTVKATGTTVFAATMHLPQENGANACSGAGDTGLGGTGIHLGADAQSLMNASTIRVVGIDANRTGIPASTLAGYGMTGYGTAATHGSSKIDYLFVRGTVHSSPVSHTVATTKSNHLALYGFIDF